jgi:LysR family glycine cleavage system transcriptional activator
MKLPPLNALRAFECAARTGSFSAAGAELGVTSAAVSLQVKNLEDWLGLQLFSRNANRIRLTDAGRDYYANAASALRDIAGFTQALSEGTNPRPLVVSATPALAHMWLPARMASFAKARPAVPVLLRAESEETDLEAEGIDLRLCYGGEHPDYRIEELFRDRLVPVAAKAGALAEMPLISVNWGVSISTVPGWAQYFAAYPQAHRGPPLYSAGSVPAVVSMVQAGLGAALLPEQVVAGEISSGCLVRLPGGALEMPRPYVAVSAHHNARSRRIAAFLEALRG